MKNQSFLYPVILDQPPQMPKIENGISSSHFFMWLSFNEVPWGEIETRQNDDGTYTHSLVPLRASNLGHNGNSFRQRPDGKFENY